MTFDPEKLEAFKKALGREINGPNKFREHLLYLQSNRNGEKEMSNFKEGWGWGPWWHLVCRLRFRKYLKKYDFSPFPVEYPMSNRAHSCLNCGKKACSLAGVGNQAATNENDGCWLGLKQQP